MNLKINYILSFLAKIFIALTILVVLFSSIRGSMGNPDVDDLLKPYWRDNGVFELSPERGRFALTYTLIENNSLYFPVNLARFIIPDLGYYNGNYVSLFAPAISFVVAPGYFIGKMFQASQFGAFTVITLFAYANLIIIKKIVKYLTGNEIAGWISGMIFVFATPAYAYAVNLYQHHVSTFLILSSILIIMRSKSLWSMFIVWFFCAISVSVDYPNLFLMFPIGLTALINLVDIEKVKNKLNIKIKVLYGLALLGIVLPTIFLGWFNSISYGSPFTALGSSKIKAVRDIDESGLPTDPKKADPQVVSEFVGKDQKEVTQSGYFKSRNLINGLYLHFLSPDRGIIYFTPVILMGICGVIILQKNKNRYLPMMVGILFANIILYSMWGDPWGGWAFGSRYLIPAYSILAILLGVALSSFRRNVLFMIIFYVLFVYSIFVNTLGALTTSANPPKVEALPLEAISGKQERYSYDRNWEFLNTGRSKSFVYLNWGQKYLNSVSYYYLMSGLITLISTSLILLLVFRKENK